MPDKILKTILLPDGILHIILSRPHALNTLNAALINALKEEFVAAKIDPSIKAILLSGEGKAFCAGADIHELTSLDAQSGYIFSKSGQYIFNLLETMGKPSLAAIHGCALGGGCELAMAATLRIATNNTAFGQPEIKLGVIPGFGGTQRLSRLIGKARALDLCLTGRLINANEALAWGLINEIVSDVPLIDRAIILLQTLIQLPPLALKCIIDVIHSSSSLTLPNALELEASHFSLCCATQDKQEGVAAFLEKRSPQFCGK